MATAVSRAMNALTPRQLEVVLLACIQAGYPLMITGAPGIGKTEICKGVVHGLPDTDLVLWHPVVDDVTDYKGLPDLNGDTPYAVFKLYANLGKLVYATRRTVVIFDDMGQAAQSVQAAIMQLILAREINGVRIPDCVVFIACTNRVQDMAGVNGLIEPLKSRFVSIVELVPEVEDWAYWAECEGLSPMLVAYIRYRGVDTLSHFAPTRALTNSPSPRTWAHVSQDEGLGLPAEIERAMMAGSVGDTYATEYLVFRAMYSNIIKVADILANPSTADIPTQPDRLYATASALAQQATAKNLHSIAVYAERMLQSKLGEFAALIFQSATRRDKSLTMTPAYIRANSGPLGQLLTGSIV